MPTGSVSPAPAARPARPPAPRRTPVETLLGVVGGAMVVLAVVLLFVGGPSDGAATPGTRAPALELLDPAPGSSVPARPTLVFASGAELVRMPGGWGVGDLHLHVEIDGREFMPSTAEIERVAAGTYRWTVGPLDPGVRTLRLFWAGPDHRAMDEGATPRVSVRVDG
jgi:hypothetical protein